MPKDDSLIARRREHFDIVALQDPGVLDEFLDQPLTFIAESITGALAGGRTGLQISGGRIVQAILKGKLFEQWALEFKTLREKGRIPDCFADKKYGFQTWVELMTIIDEQSPDSDRLEALKAMFFAVNKTNATDNERIVAYQLWQMAKALGSGELLLLKVAYESRATYGDSSLAEKQKYTVWAHFIAQTAGHGMVGLVDLHEKKPTELGLFSPKVNSGPTTYVNTINARLTDLGIRFCENITTYQLETCDNEAV